MEMKFSHPNENYTMTFELMGDLKLDKIGVDSTLNIPRCEIKNWQFNNNPFWDFETSQTIIITNPIKHKLDAIRDNLIANVKVPLNISNEMFLSNTKLTDGLWSLEELLTKAKIEI